MSELKMPLLPGLPVVVPDEQLLERAQAGDRDALGELFRRHFNHASNIARQMASGDYEDIVQDACLKATESIAQCRGSFGAWFSMIVRNQAINRYRENRRAVNHTLSLDEFPLETPDARGLADFEFSERSDRLAGRLEKVLAALTPAQRQVLSAMYAEVKENDRSVALLKRTAKRMGKTEGAVRNALFQIRRVIGERAPDGLIEEIAGKRDREDILMAVLQQAMPHLQEDHLRSQLSMLAANGARNLEMHLAAIHLPEEGMWEMDAVVLESGSSEPAAILTLDTQYGNKSREELNRWAATAGAALSRVGREIGLKFLPPDPDLMKLAPSKAALHRWAS